MMVFQVLRTLAVPLSASLLAALSAMPAGAADVVAASPFPDDPVRIAVEQFLQRETAGIPGKVAVQVMPPSGGRAPACETPQPFLPRGTAGLGRITVGVRCGGDKPWTRYVQAQVSARGTYYVAARALGPGDTIAPADLLAREGDLSTLPRGAVMDARQAAGAVTLSRIAAGSVVRTDLLRKGTTLRAGQNVGVIVEGEGFRISGDGKLVRDAAEGGTAQVRLRNGQVASGVVKGDKVVLAQ